MSTPTANQRPTHEAISAPPPERRAAFLQPTHSTGMIAWATPDCSRTPPAKTPAMAPLPFPMKLRCECDRVAILSPPQTPARCARRQPLMNDAPKLTQRCRKHRSRRTPCDAVTPLRHAGEQDLPGERALVGQQSWPVPGPLHANDVRSNRYPCMTA